MVSQFLQYIYSAIVNLWHGWDARRLPTVVNNPLIALQFPDRVSVNPPTRNRTRQALHQAYHLCEKGRPQLLSLPLLGFAMSALQRKLPNWSKRGLEALADTYFFEDANCDAKETELAMRHYFRQLFEATFDRSLEEGHRQFERFLANTISIKKEQRFQLEKIYRTILELTRDEERIFLLKRLNLDVSERLMGIMIMRDETAQRAQRAEDRRWGVRDYVKPNECGNMELDSILPKKSFGPSVEEEEALGEVYKRFSQDFPRNANKQNVFN